MFMWSCPDSRDNKGTGGAEGFGSLIEKAMAGLSGKERCGKEEIEEAWRKAAGEAASKQSKPVSIKRGDLVVSVGNSGWLYELSVRKEEIVKKLKAELKGKKITGLRLRIGDVKSPRPK